MEAPEPTRFLHNGYDTIWQIILPYIDTSADRNSISLVCRRWFEIDNLTRKHVTMSLCYTASPRQLSTRFPHLESLKLKGKPRTAKFKFNLIPEDWGGYASPWVEEISKAFTKLKHVHLRRMIVTDEDLELLAKTRGSELEVLKLDKCSRFSTNGLLHIIRYCKNLKTLVVEKNIIKEYDGEWLHQLALNNTVLENLKTDLMEVTLDDLELLARNCPLVSVNINHDSDILHLKDFFLDAVSLEEFAGGYFQCDAHVQVGADVIYLPVERYSGLSLPQKLCRLGIRFFGFGVEIPTIIQMTCHLTRLDLLSSQLYTKSYCLLLERCPNLQVLEARNLVGDRGLEVLARVCKKMKRLKIERCRFDNQEMLDVHCNVTQRGLTALAHGCLELEYLEVYVFDIDNASLECVGAHLKNLCDFRLGLSNRKIITDMPLDVGVRSLLRGCNKLRRCALYLQPRGGGLTDTGLGYVGEYSSNVRWMALGYVGESDRGILELSKGCPNLRRLEIRGCCFSERALAQSTLQLPSLRYLWVQGYRATSPNSYQEILAMARPYWNIEIIPAYPSIRVDSLASLVDENLPQILAYYSLAGRRADCPTSVLPLYP